MSEKGYRASFSRLDTFERCPKKYWLRYVKKLSAPRADSLEFGTIVHAALEDTVRELVERNHRGAIPQDVLRAAYEENWTKAGCTDRALYEEGRSMLDKWRERFGEFDAGRVLGLEQRIAFTFGGVQVSGGGGPGGPYRRGHDTDRRLQDEPRVDASGRVQPTRTLWCCDAEEVWSSTCSRGV